MSGSDVLLSILQYVPYTKHKLCFVYGKCAVCKGVKKIQRLKVRHSSLFK